MEETLSFDEIKLKEINDRIHKKYTKSEAKRKNTIILAWLGDGVYSEYIRQYLSSEYDGKINYLHKISTNYVSAKAQAYIIEKLYEELTEDEKYIYKRGKNTSSRPPKNTSILDYKLATGFEALLGWLFLIGDFNRINEICIKSIYIINNIEKE